MWRLVILAAFLLLITVLLVSRTSVVLKWVASIVYSPYSPFGRTDLPLWAAYYLNPRAYEHIPGPVRRLEEDVRTVGYILLIVPITLVVTIVLVSG